MEKVLVTTKVGRREYNKGNLSSDEMKVMDYLIGNKSATLGQLEVASCETWVVRSMRRRGLIKEKEE